MFEGDKAGEWTAQGEFPVVYGAVRDLPESLNKFKRTKTVLAINTWICCFSRFRLLGRSSSLSPTVSPSGENNEKRPNYLKYPRKILKNISPEYCALIFVWSFSFILNSGFSAIIKWFKFIKATPPPATMLD